MCQLLNTLQQKQKKISGAGIQPIQPIVHIYGCLILRALNFLLKPCRQKVFLI